MDERHITRFWQKVERRGPDECWEWRAFRSVTGYGRSWFGPWGMQLGHRASWFIAHGEWPTLLVCHTRDNRGCVNPSHLFLGTQADNMVDMVSKAKPHRRVGLKGEKHYATALTVSDVLTIRARRAAGEKLRVIGESYGLTLGGVHNICIRKSWKHVP